VVETFGGLGIAHKTGFDGHQAGQRREFKNTHLPGFFLLSGSPVIAILRSLLSAKTVSAEKQQVSNKLAKRINEKSKKDISH